MSKKERIRFAILVLLRAFVSLLDLFGILGIGLLSASIGLFVSQGSDPTRVLTIGTIEVPAVTAQSLPIFAFVILALFIAKAGLSLILTQRLAKHLANIEARSAREIARNSLASGLEPAREYTRDEVLYAVQIGSPAAFGGLLNSLGTLAAEGFLFILVFSAFTVIDAGTALASLAYFGVIVALVQFFLGNIMQKTSEAATKSSIGASSALGDLWEILREAEILGKRDFFVGRVYQLRFEAAGKTAIQTVLANSPRYIIETALIVAIALFILAQSQSGDIVSSAVTAGVFLSGGLRLTASLLPLQTALLTIKQSIPPAVQALQILERLPQAKELKQALEISGLENRPLGVVVKHLDFAYKTFDKPLLDNLNMNISPGSQVAIIGPSGAGKSTLAELILGLISPTDGQILIEGLKPEVLHDSFPGSVSYVPQKPGMIHGSIAQNIAIGIETDQIDNARLEECIEKAHLKLVIENLENGVQTELGPRSDVLSGGQLQRIGLARALYTRPKLLVMDEATSGLDADSESEINSALNDLRGLTTVIIIAHRLNTIQHSDNVYLLEAGKISASGPFAHLLKTNETVRRLTSLMAVGEPLGDDFLEDSTGGES